MILRLRLFQRGQHGERESDGPSVWPGLRSSVMVPLSQGADLVVVVVAVDFSGELDGA